MNNTAKNNSTPFIPFLFLFGEKSEKKRVSIETAKRNTYSVLIISNSCDIAPKVNGRRLISSKEDHELHGYGLKSVATTLKKYQGDFDWVYNSDSHLFTITVMIGEIKGK